MFRILYFLAKTQNIGFPIFFVYENCGSVIFKVENDESVRDDPDKTWVFKRYVSCTTHGCLSEKRVAKEQVWKKKKNGLYA